MVHLPTVHLSSQGAAFEQRLKQVHAASSLLTARDFAKKYGQQQLLPQQRKDIDALGASPAWLQQFGIDLQRGTFGDAARLQDAAVNLLSPTSSPLETVQASGPLRPAAPMQVASAALPGGVFVAKQPPPAQQPMQPAMDITLADVNASLGKLGKLGDSLKTPQQKQVWQKAIGLIQKMLDEAISKPPRSEAEMKQAQAATRFAFALVNFMNVQGRAPRSLEVSKATSPQQPGPVVRLGKQGQLQIAPHVFEKNTGDDNARLLARGLIAFILQSEKASGQ
jgi:hypothetical protein